MKWLVSAALFAIYPAIAAAPKPLPQAVCGGCHVFPAPDLLDRSTWTNQTLPRMKIRAGLAPEEIDRHPEADLLKATGVFLDAPVVNSNEWQQIVDFYATNAPAKSLPQKPHAAIQMGLPGFRVEVSRFRENPPSTTMVHISPREQLIYFGDDESKSLTILDANLKRIQRIPIGNTPASLHSDTTNVWVTMIGSFMPSEARKGVLVRGRRVEGGLADPKIMVSGLPRTTHGAFADLNGDGREDFTLSVFGSNTGRFSWFEQSADGEYIEHELWNKPGAVRSEIRDFNDDSTPDIAVLVAQETESLFLFINDGRGDFQQVIVFQTNPLFGHTYFESGDFNNDGKIDFLVANGDNGEYPSPLKRFHGLRIYAGEGDLRWHEAWFYPLNGAFGARARDFDLDDDLDIVANSFFPDYESNPRESFVLLENRGPKGSFNFAARTFPNCISGRWLTMDAGDLDGDGDEDIALGSYIHGPSKVPQFLMNIWETNGPSVLLLRNTARSAPKPPTVPKSAETAPR